MALKTESPAREPIYFYVTGKWYTGKLPNFYDVSTLSSTKILEDNYEKIKEEILSFYDRHANIIRPNNTSRQYKEEGWKNLSLYGFMLRYPNHIKYFPFLGQLIETIPNLITAQIAVLEPHVRVKAHFGDTNALIRSHLGIVVPGQYPELGFRNGSQERCWEEGKVLAICIAHRHYVWNNTDKKRIVLIIDTIHPDYVDKKYLIATGILASAVMKIITYKFPFTKKFPEWLVLFFHSLIRIPFRIILFLQNSLNINLAPLLVKLK